MKKRTKQRSVSRSITSAVKDRTGGAALVTIILLLAFLVLITASVAFRGLSDAEVGFNTQYGTTAILAAESCTEEAMLMISRNPNYSGGTLTVGQMECTISVTGNPCGTCTIDAVATGEDLTRKIRAEIVRSGNSIDINSWEEVE